MSTLTIEGDPLAIRGLADELTDRHYLGSEFRVAIIESDMPVPLTREEAYNLLAKLLMASGRLYRDKYYAAVRMGVDEWDQLWNEKETLRSKVLDAMCGEEE